MKKGRGRVKAQLFESDSREMTKGNAVQHWCSVVPRRKAIVSSGIIEEQQISSPVYH